MDDTQEIDSVYIYSCIYLENEASEKETVGILKID